MKVIGLTGGIGAGKSVSAGLLRKMSIPVVDTDDLAREVVQPGHAGLERVCAVFGREYLTPAAELDRSKLARRVFNNPADLEKLESILHPLIRERWIKQAAEWRSAGCPIGVVVIPLLFETAAEQEFDAIFCLACTRTTQQARLMSRGWSQEEISRRLAAQWPMEKKIHAAHYVIWTEAGLDLHQEQLNRVINRLSKE